MLALITTTNKQMKITKQLSAGTQCLGYLFDMYILYCFIDKTINNPGLHTYKMRVCQCVIWKREGDRTVEHNNRKKN